MTHNGSPGIMGKPGTGCHHSDIDAKDYVGIPFGDRQLCTPLLTKGGTPPTNYGHALPHCNCCHMSANRCLHKESITIASTNSSPARRTNHSSSDTLDKFPTNETGGGSSNTLGPHYLIFDPDVIPDQTRSATSGSSTSASNVRKPLSTFLGKSSKNDPNINDRKNSFPMSILNNRHSLHSQDSQDSNTGVSIGGGGTCPRHSGTNQIADSNQNNSSVANQQPQPHKVKDSVTQGLLKDSGVEAAASMEDLENDANERKKLEVFTWK